MNEWRKPRESRKERFVAFLICLSVGLSFSLTFAGDEEQVLVGAGEWESQSWGDYPRHVNHQRKLMRFFLDSGVERYTLQYSYCADASHAPLVETPEGYLGMPGPSSCNWYHNGFLYLMVNEKDAGRVIPTIRFLEQGSRGLVQVLWSVDELQARCTLLMLPHDPTLYVELSALPREEIKSFEVRLVAYPAAYTSQADRWTVTPVREVQQIQKLEIAPQDEWWLLHEDRKVGKGAGQEAGPCGVAFLPEEVESAYLDVGNYAVVTKLVARKEVARLRLALWDFGKKTNTEAAAYLRTQASRALETLRHTDFSCRQLQPTYWKARKDEITALLPFAEGMPNLANPVKALLQETDSLQSQVAQSLAAGKPVAPSVEDKILENMRKLDEQLWELKFAKLFAE